LAELDFRVDTQADFTSIPIPTAQREAIPFSQTQPRTVVGLVGQATTYRDRIRIVIAGREHDWPCDFVVPPPQELGRQPRELLPALGRSGFLDEYAITVDSGYLVVTRIGPIRRRLRRFLHVVWARFGMVQPHKQPL
jgi:hypothetical protein